MSRIRFALRTLAKSPLLSLVVILSLGLGIGVNTAIFSLLHEVVLSALPIPHPEQIVLLTSPGDLKHGRTQNGDAGGMDYVFNWRTFRELEKHTEAASVAAFCTMSSNIAFSRQTVRGEMMLVSGEYFPVLGIQPYAGRLIDAKDDAPGNAIAVIGYRYWRDKLGADPSVLNQTIKVNGQPFTVAGIAPSNFIGTTVGTDPSVYVPISFKPHLTEDWNGTDKLDDYWIYLLARLKPGITTPQAEGALNGPYAGVVAEMAATINGKIEKTPRFREQKLSLKAGRQGNSSFRDEYRSALNILLLATGLVLLIAMANAANLLLARSVERRKELAIRAAIGASRWELMAQFLTEALLLAVIGGIAGIAIAFVTLKLLLTSSTAGESLNGASLNYTILWFSVALSLATGILFGLYPAFDAARSTLATTLNDESGKASSSRGSSRLRTALVCAQLTIAIVLLVPTGLFLKSLVNLLHVNLGIRTANVITFFIAPRWNGYAPAQSQAIFDRAETELAAIPGVRSAVGSSVPLIGGSNWGTSFTTEGLAPGAQKPNTKYDEVGPEFFAKTGIPLLAGRDIKETDTATSPKVVVVNETWVKQIFNGANPIGHRIGFGKDGALDTEIVGIVKDSHYSSVRDQPPPVFYRPWRQDAKLGFISLYVRTELPPQQIIPQIRAVMSSIDRDIPLSDMRTLEEQVHDNIRSDELMMRLAAAFAALATTLAMLGLYGVMAYGVARRRREIGIRMALGAAPSRIRGMVMRELIWILAIGLTLGIPAALAATRVIESRLFGVHAKDLTILVSATLLLSLTAAAAAWWPARRASKVDPLTALRCD
jgi:putative ABC transport system permease protein